MPFHLELRQRPHVARAFNLDEREVVARFVAPVRAGRTLVYQEREWSPRKLRLTILEGPELRPDEIGMGRGWANATRHGTDVTERFLASGERQPPPRPAGVDQLKERLLGRLAAGELALGEAVVLADELLPGRRVSERLGLTEMAVWELLHERRAELLGAGGTAVPEAAWQERLLAWGSWGAGDQATTSSIRRIRSESVANR